MERQSMAERDRTGKASSMGQFLTGEYDYHYPRRGDIRRGTVLSVEPHQIVVDIGAKRDAIVPEYDLGKLGEEEVAKIKVGDEVDVYVLRPEDREGNIVVSLNLARIHKDWLRAEELLESGEVFEGEVVGYNKGGVVVPFGKIRGFVPASHLMDMPSRLPREERMAKLAEFVGKTLPLKVIEVDRNRRRLIFSERAAHRQWREQQKELLMDELCEGEVRHGVVSGLCDFGAFVDLGGADGLVHVSELSWDRAKHPREVLKVGDEVDVYVLRLDRERKRIALSIKRLQPDPWTLVDDKYKVGQLVKGTITKVVDFGAFARIEPGLEGLIRASEFAEGGEAVKVGDEVTLCIVSIDSAHRRMGLSLRKAQQGGQPKEATGEAAEETAEGGAEVEALAEESEAIEGGAAMEGATDEESLQPSVPEAVWSDLAKETAEPQAE